MARRRIFMIVVASATLAAAWAAAPASAIRLGPEPGHSPNADDIGTSYWVMLAIAVLLLVAINAALIAAVVRFRERRGREPSRFAAGRGALRPALAGLAVFAVVVFVFGIVMTDNVRSVEASGPSGLGANPSAQVGVSGATEPTEAGGQATSGGADEAALSSPLVINAIGQQWLWRFEYPGGEPGHRTFTYGALVVPVDTTVLLNVTSTDVVHSWWIPALGGQVQAVPGTTSQTWFKADEVGTYPGRSTVFSGTGYPAMRAWVKVVSVPEYQAFVDQLNKDLSAAQDAIFRAQTAAARAGGEGLP